MAQDDFEEFAKRVKQAESGGRRYDSKGNLLTSPKGAQGEMQVMPGTQKSPGFGVEPARAKTGEEIARVGKDYLRAMEQRYGNKEYAAVAYNWGPGNADKWIAQGADFSKLPKETQDYVKKVAPPAATAAEQKPVAPTEVPDYKALGRGPMTADLGSGYKAALALSFLGDEEDSDEKKLDEEEKTAAKELADYKSFNALSGLEFEPTKVPLVTAQAPAQVPVQRMADGGEVQGFGSNSPLIPEQMAPGGAIMLAEGGEADSTAAQMLKQIVPMDTRIFGSTLFGSREPITERNFTPEELAGIQQAVDTAVKRTGQAQKGSVQYVDYPRGEEIGPGYQPVGKTLGRFVYEKQPDGTTIVRDRYDFYNEGRAKNIEAYEKMGGGEKALTVAGRALKNLFTGNIPGIPQELGDAYIGREGRDVTIKLPPVRRAGGGDAEPTPEELEAASRPATVNPNIVRQGAAARQLAAMRDVNTLPDPRTYAAMSGFLGTPPDQQGFSVMHPDIQGIKKAGDVGFGAGTAAQVAPVVSGAAKMLGKLTGSALNERMLAGQSLTPGFNTPAPINFAVKPRGGTVLHTYSGEADKLPVSKLDELLADYRKVAARDHGASDELVEFIRQKAPRYFTTVYGTADDPLRTAIRERAIEPFGRDLKKIPPYLVDAAKFPQARGHLQAKHELERMYDELTGVDPMILKPEVGGPSMTEVRRSINQKMAAEGVPVEAQNAPSVTGYSQSEFAEYPYGTKMLSTLVEQEGQLPSNIQYALRNAEPMYDISPGFDMLTPHNVVDALKQIPPNKLKSMSFPEALIQGTQSLAPVRDYRTAIDMADRGAKIPPAVLQQFTKPVAPAPGGEWVQITDPVATELEGKLMKHSVGGYSGGDSYGTGYTGLPYGGKLAFDDGLVRVFSLRDKAGEPTITVEMARPKGQQGWNVTQVRGRFNSEPMDKESVFNLFDKIDSTEGLNRIKSNSYSRSASGADLEHGSTVDWGGEYDLWKQGISE